MSDTGITCFCLLTLGGFSPNSSSAQVGFSAVGSDNALDNEIPGTEDSVLT